MRDWKGEGGEVGVRWWGSRKKIKKEGKGGRVRRFFHRGASSHPSEGESLGCSMTVPCSFK